MNSLVTEINQDTECQRFFPRVWPQYLVKESTVLTSSQLVFCFCFVLFCFFASMVTWKLHYLSKVKATNLRLKQNQKQELWYSILSDQVNIYELHLYQMQLTYLHSIYIRTSISKVSVEPVPWFSEPCELLSLVQILWYFPDGQFHCTINWWFRIKKYKHQWYLFRPTKQILIIAKML